MSYHRVYISKTNEEPFKAETNKSGLVNELLEYYYTKKSAPVIYIDETKLTDKQIKRLNKMSLSANKIIKIQSTELTPDHFYTPDPTYTDSEEAA